MRTVLLNAGPIAHLSGERPDLALTGVAMMDMEALVHPSGFGLVIEGGIFTHLSDSESLAEEYNSDSQTIVRDLGGRAIVPGLVDAHTHLLWAGDRSNEMRLRQSGASYRDIAAAGGGISSTVSHTRKALHNENEGILSEGRRRLSIALRCGTTAIEAKSGYGLDTNSELALIEAASILGNNSPIEISPTWLGAHDTPPDKSRKAYVEEILSEQLPAVVEQGLARYADVFCEDGWFTIEETASICEAAAESGIEIRLHVDEFADCGGLQLAAELGAVTADHAVHSTDDARASASDSGTLQGFLPGTPYVLGTDLWPPIQQSIAEDWAWSLATDFNPNCHSLSLPFTGSVVTQRLGIDPLAALVACSRNPATGLLRADGLKHGIIEVGAAANLNVLWGEHIEGWCQTPGQTPFLATISNGIWHQHE